jgi:alkylation response protein AidB-like acyl-CoA dehydrogenase
VRTEAELLEIVEGLRAPFSAGAAQHDREASFPRENFDLLREKGMLALTAPLEWGGEGLWSGERYLTYYRLLSTLAAFDCNTSQLLQVHSHALGIISNAANDAQREKYLGPIVREGKILASVGSESAPSKASNGLYNQELQPQEDGSWILTCEKHFASVSAGADFLLIWLAVPGEEPYEQRTVCVIVPTDAPEVELIDTWDVLGMRATVSWTVKITGLRVEADAIVGEPGYWVSRDARTFSLGFASNHLGQAEGILQFCIDWVAQRPHLQNSDLMLFRFGDLGSKIFVVRAGMEAAAREWERGVDFDRAELLSLQVLHMAKQVLLEISQTAFDICGARAIFRSYPLEQAYRDARSFTLHTRDDHLTSTVGRGILTGEFSGKGYIDGATVPRIGK